MSEIKQRKLPLTAPARGWSNLTNGCVVPAIATDHFQKKKKKKKKSPLTGWCLSGCSILLPEL